jgi:hypothetical protein
MKLVYFSIFSNWLIDDYGSTEPPEMQASPKATSLDKTRKAACYAKGSAENGADSGEGMPQARVVIIIGLFVAFSLLSATAAAQDGYGDQKNEIGGSVGRIFISDQGIRGTTYFNPFVRSGKGFTFEVDYARRFLGNEIYAISAEVPAVFNLDEDLNSGSNVVPEDYQQIFITPALRANFFPNTRVSPWLSFGGGFGQFSENKTLIYGGANPGGSSTSGVLQGGFGLDTRLLWGRLRKLVIRGEVRDFWSGTPDLPLAPTGKTRQHNYLVGGGAVWHF